MSEERRPPESEHRIWHFWFWAVVFLMGGMLYFYFLYPRGQLGPEQPIPFSHRVHAGVKAIDCRFCHAFVDKSARAGIPTMEKCFYCHQYVIPNHPELVSERKRLDGGEPVRWKKLFWVPDFVQFRHQPHVRWADLACDNCHQEVRTKDRLPRRRFQMGFCIGCHRMRPRASTDCWLACHH